MDKICFSKDTFYIYTFILIGVLVYCTYFYYHQKKEQKENISNIDINTGLSNDSLKTRLKMLQQNLYNSQLDNQKCNYDLAYCKSDLNKCDNGNSGRHNNGTGPERRYVSPNQPSSSYTVLGYVYKDTERYPLYGRYKFPGRSDKFEYYIIDETRNRLKIPFKTSNDNELYDGDSIDIPTLDTGYSAKIYDYSDFRYNPNF